MFSGNRIVHSKRLFLPAVSNPLSLVSVIAERFRQRNRCSPLVCSKEIAEVSTSTGLLSSRSFRGGPSCQSPNTSCSGSRRLSRRELNEDISRICRGAG